MRMLRTLVVAATAAFCLASAAAAVDLNSAASWNVDKSQGVSARFGVYEKGYGDNRSLIVKVDATTKDGVAGWASDPISVVGGATYTYTDMVVTNNAWSNIVVHYLFPDWHDDQYGNYVDGCLSEFWDNGQWGSCKATFTVPPGATRVVIVRNIEAKSNTSMRFDNAKLLRN